MSDSSNRLAAALADRYRIERELGQGGMATVYLAEDLKHERKVAIKVLQPELAAVLGAQRFVAEIKTTASLNHPHILPLYDSGEAENFLYYVMPYVEGESLRNRLDRERRMSIGDALDLARDVADALGYAHAHGVLHRDIKPENILLEGGHALLADFGIARAIDAAGGARVTQTGLTLGTPAYMSPEQAAGATDLDARSDLYSLGCVLFEALAGEPPFRGASVQSVIAARFTETPPPVTARRPDVPSGASAVVAQMLALETGDRPASAAAVMAQLRASGEQSAAPPPPTARARVSIAVLPFADLSPAGDQEYFCEGMAEEIMTALGHVAELRVAARTSAFRARRDDQDLQAIGRRLAVDHVLEGSVRTAGKRVRLTARLVEVGSGYQRWSERFDREMEDVFALQDDVAAGVVRAITAELAPVAVRPRPQVQNLEAYQRYLKGRHFRYTKNDHASAVRCFEQAVALDPTHAPSWLGLAETTALVAIYALGPSHESYAAARRALATAREQQGPTADAEYVAGMIAFGERNFAECEAAFRRAIALDPNHVQALCWQGQTWSVLDHLDDAERPFRRARETDVLAAYPYAMTGVSFVMCGRYAEAERYFEQAFAFEPGSSLARWPWAIAKVGLGDPAAAVRLLEPAVTPSHRGGSVHALLGWALAKAGRMDDARAVLAELEARPPSAPANAFQAWVYAAIGRLDDAWRVLQQARAEAQGMLLVALRIPMVAELIEDPRFGPFEQSLGLPPMRARHG